jgi:TonB family protein
VTGPGALADFMRSRHRRTTFTLPAAFAALAAFAAFAAAAPGAAFAQQGGAAAKPESPEKPAEKPAEAPPDRGEVSVPRGQGGVILRNEPPKDEPAKGVGGVTMPRPLNYEPPVFPEPAKSEGREGTVTLELDIDAKGAVTRVAVVDPAGYGFDEAATQAAKKLVFEPAKKPDGTPFAARIRYRYTFTQEKAPTPEAPIQGAEEVAPEAAGLRGVVLTSVGDVPLAGATITARGPNGDVSQRSTDAEGRFDLEGVAPGTYSLRIEAPGYSPLELEEDLSEPLSVKYRLAVQGDAIEITVRGQKPPREVVKRTLQAREISRIPGTNGDALRSIQSLPGVARPPGLAGLLLVRGSGPQDTQTFIDGTGVPLIYHFGGLSSVVPTEILEKIDFYPGNFSTQYGRVMGGIVDAGIRSPKDDGQYHGLAQVDLIDARALAEGPIPYLDGWRFIAAGRRSYVDTWLGPVLESAGAGVTQAPVYYDYQFLVEKDFGAGGRFRTAFLGSDDALEILVKDPQPGEPALSGNIGLHTAFQRLQFRYDNDLGEDDDMRAVVALGQDNIDFGLGAFYFLLDVKTLSARAEYTRKISRGVHVNTGVDLLFGDYSVALRAPGQPRPGQPPNQPFTTRNVRQVEGSGTTSQPAGYVELELDPDPRFKLVPGVRFDYTSFTSRVDTSPRVNARFALEPEYPRTTLKAGVGVFHQPPQYQEGLPPTGTPDLQPNRAMHYALGAEQDLTRQIEVSAEGFFKQLDNVVVPQPTADSTSLAYANIGTGYAVGTEILLKYKPDDRFFGWAAYTLSRSVRRQGPGEELLPVAWDQTHILTVLGSYQLGHGWEIGARFRLISGNLTTPNVCNIEDGDCDPNRTNALFHAASGAYTPIPLTQANSERLPLYHQLDLRVDKRWKFPSWQLSAYLDVQNAYNRGNVEAISYNFNYTGRQFVTGLPILPSLGLRADF